MEYYDFEYIPVAEKRARNQKSVEKLRKKNPDIAPVVMNSNGRKLARTWWGEAWNNNLESYSDYANRIGRGRSYVRHGAVLDLRISAGKILALVQGRQARPYEVCIDIQALDRTTWQAITRTCEGKIDSLPELIEGRFPKAFRPDWLYSDAEREELGRRGVPLERRGSLVAREEIYFRHAVSCAAEKLYLSYPTGGEDGRETMPSHFLEAFASPSAVIEAPPLHRRWTEAFDPTALPGFQAKAAAEAEREGIAYGAWDGVLSQPGIAAELANRFGDGFLWSAGLFRDYGTCPFLFFCGRVLGLAPREDAGEEAGGLEVGDLYHRILQRFFQTHRGEALRREKLPGYREELARVSEEVFREFESDGSSFHPGLWEIKKGEMRGRLARLLEYETDLAEATGGQLRPAFFELEFGSGEIPALVLERDGGRLQVRGKIDRVDADPGGRFAVYDYKTSGTPDLKAIREGTEFQLPLYIVAAQKCLSAEVGGAPAETEDLSAEVALSEPVGGAYYSIRDLDRNAGIWKAEYRDWTGISKQAKSNLDGEVWEAVFSGTEDYLWTYAGRIRAGRFPVAPKVKCPEYCHFRPICRFDRRRLNRKEANHD